LAAALRSRGVEVETCRVFAGDEVPARPGGYRGVVVMGGPVSASSDEGFPTRRRELALLQAALEAEVPTLGVCLGAQLLALATGGRVFPGPAGPEIGWGVVRLTPAAAGDALLGGVGPTLRVLHWHGDTFEAGPGSVLLASSERYPAQAFRAGTAAWGLQFHLEVDEAAARAMVEAFAGEAALAPGGAEGIVRGAAENAGPAEPSGAAGRGGAAQAAWAHGGSSEVLGHFAALVAGAGADGGG
jgi:GMP synthase-like glutamine amidotransferase